MRRERVSDDVYVFTSDLYAQVTASAVVAAEGIVVVDTLPFPEETSEMIAFLRQLRRGEIRYLVNTHWHGDHTHGNCLFPWAQLVAHRRCAQIMPNLGLQAFEEAKRGAPELEEVQLRVADVTFDEGDMFLHVGGKSLQMILTPGHTPDSTVVYIKENKVLLAADTVMPIPYFAWGNREDFIKSLREILELNLECVVQGHGEVLLRGEIRASIHSSLRYLDVIEKRVKQIIEANQGAQALRRIDVESCGVSRIPLNGLVQQLHLANLQTLYEQMTSTSPNRKLPLA